MNRLLAALLGTLTFRGTVARRPYAIGCTVWVVLQCLGLAASIVWFALVGTYPVAALLALAAIACGVPVHALTTRRLRDRGRRAPALVAAVMIGLAGVAPYAVLLAALAFAQPLLGDWTRAATLTVCGAAGLWWFVDAAVLPGKTAPNAPSATPVAVAAPK